jgi:hypothetical protein
VPEAGGVARMTPELEMPAGEQVMHVFALN